MWRSRLTAAAVLLPAVVALSSAPAWARHPGPGGGSGGSGGGSSSTPTGLDVSYPQCSDSPPAGEAFAIVGLNGGLANDYNSCLRAELSYAQGLKPTTGTTQPVAQLYVNTADPGNTVSDWPYGTAYLPGSGLGQFGVQQSSTGLTPYGPCASTGTNTAACAYVYGYDMVAGVNSTIVGDVSYLASQSSTPAGSLRWWLDVETQNSWLSNTQMNVADLQGMVAALGYAGVAAANVGVYSTASQWNTITGTPPITYNGSPNTLYGLNEWVTGAQNLSGAESDCTQTSFTHGTMQVSQWFSTPYDGDYSCTH